MKTLTDAEIIPNYKYAIEGFADDGDDARCNRCGAKAKTGNRVHAWQRVPNQATHLPSGIELCDACSAEISALKQLG